MSAEAKAKYMRLMEALFEARAKAPGGRLTDDEESDHVEGMDGLWWEMTDDEQQEVERWLAEHPGRTQTKATAP